MKTFSFSHLMVPALLIVSGALTGSVLTWVASLRRKENAENSDIYNVAATTARAGRWASATGAAAGTSVGAGVADDASVQKLRRIIETIDSERRADDLHHFGREMAARNATMALALAGEIAGDSDQLMYMKGVFATWAQQSPQEAAAYAINSLPAGRLRAEAIRLSMGEWGEIDARGAFEWMESTLQGPVKEASLVALAEGWSRRSPEQAAAWFAESGSTSQGLLTAIGSTWARQDSVAALQWAAALGDPALRTTSLNSVLGEMARLDPVAAVQAAAPDLQAGASGEAAAADRLLGAGAAPDVVIVPGGGSRFHDVSITPAHFAGWATALAARGHSVVFVAGPAFDVPLPESPRLRVLRGVGGAALMAILQRTQLVLVNGGDTLLQALALGRPCVTVPIAGDQAARIARCAALGMVVSPAIDQVEPACAALLADAPARQALVARVQAIGLRDAMPGIVATLGEQLGLA